MARTPEAARYRRIAAVWGVWIVIYNVLFLWMLWYAMRAPLELWGFLPRTVWLYTLVLFMIGAGNWILGWMAMGFTRRKLSDIREP